MDFLRGLAPKRDGDMQRAIPLLPSRFGGLRPLSAVPASDGAAGGPVEAGDAVPITASSQPTPAAESTSRPELPWHRPGPGAAVTVRAAETSIKESQPVSMRSPAATAVVPSADRGVAPRVAATAAVRLAASMTRSGVEAPNAGQPAVVVPRRYREVVTSISRPLSETVLAARPSMQAEARPVIHVTIDRLEVRAPKPERPAPASVRTRAAAPSLSLNEYLRRPRNPGGAV